MRKPIPVHLRVLARSVPSGDCLLWQGSTTKTGYGTIGAGSRTDGTRRIVLTHRAVWEAANGPVPQGLELDHLCRNRSCVNLSCLEVVTHQENCRRAEIAGRRVATLRARTHCKRGHEYNDINTAIRPNGARACRPCLRDRARAERAKARAA